MSRTSLYNEHLALNASMVNYHGWELPVQYTGILKEHLAVRQGAGMFDVSHMGEFKIAGEGAEDFLQGLVTNDVRQLQDYMIQYSPLCYDDGGIVDDLLIYRYSVKEYLLVVNAANVEKDWEYIKERVKAFPQLKLENLSSEYSQIAVQGPLAEELLNPLVDADLVALGFYHFYPGVTIAGIKDIILSRTGYTGEDGFEIYLRNESAPELWRYFLDNCQDKGLVPVGLGARDTLRFEAALPLYGNELSDQIKPLEARTSYFVHFEKPEDFPGKKALLNLKQQGIKRKIAGLEMLGRGIPRGGYQVMDGAKEVGFVTSGNYSPSTGKNLALALLDFEVASATGKEVAILIREKPVAAKVVKLPFVKKNFKR